MDCLWFVALVSVWVIVCDRCLVVVGDLLVWFVCYVFISGLAVWWLFVAYGLWLVCVCSG